MTPPLRVLHACDFLVRYTTGLATGMAQTGCDVTLLTRAHDLDFGSSPGAMRAFVGEATGGRVRHLAVPGRVRDVRRLRTVHALRARVRRIRPDVVHFQDGVTNDPRMLAVAGVPPHRYAMTVHDATAHPGDVWSPSKLRTRSALMRFAGVVFVHTEAIRDELLARERRLPPIVVVPHGVGTGAMAALPERPALLFFGRISTYYKGLDVLLDAMPLVWARVPDATLTIAGAGGIDPHPVLADPRVELRNAHVPDDEVPGLFARATCCVLPYREASQSGVGSQAKSYGRAIAASAVGGLPELVDESCGRLVPPGDPQALAAALCEILGSRALAESMGRAALSHVAKAGWSRVAELTLAAYAETLLDDGRDGKARSRP
jgi:glycosyltransferase involved in cell wall biosynthesis